MDPHIPRYYRFLVLFSRINIAFALSFFLLKDLPNPDTASGSSSVGPLITFIVVASLLFIPVPVMLYTPFRSSYYLLKPKTDG
jgi:hypothetical protein